MKCFPGTSIGSLTWPAASMSLSSTTPTDSTRSKACSGNTRRRRHGTSPSGSTGPVRGTRSNRSCNGRPTARPWRTVCCSNFTTGSTGRAPIRRGSPWLIASRSDLVVGSGHQCRLDRPALPTFVEEVGPERHDGDGHDGDCRPRPHLFQNSLKRLAYDEAEQCVTDSPQHPPDGVVGEKRPISDSTHPGDPGDHRPGERHEPPEEDGWASVPCEKRGGLGDRRVPLHGAMVENPGTDLLPHLVADRVAGDGTYHHDDDHQLQVDLVQASQHATDHHRRLTGDEEAEQERRLGKYQEAHQRVGRWSVEMEQ